MVSVKLNAHQYVLQLRNSNAEATQRPQLQVYYKGYQLDLADPTFCQLPEARTKAGFSIVICNDIAFEHTTRNRNDIVRLRRPEHTPTRWISVLYDPNADKWRVTDDTQDTTQMPISIPEDAVYVMANPHTVDLHSVRTHGRTTYLDLTQRESRTELQTSDYTTYALLASLDAQAFHKPVRTHKLRNNNVTISMLQYLP